MEPENYNYKHYQPQDWHDSYLNPGIPCHQQFAMGEVLYDSLDVAVPLKSLLGKPFVLETGSLTCPRYIQHIDNMNHLAQKYQDIPFIVVYVREEHPGELLPNHRNREDKLDRACLLNIHEGEGRPVYVDGIKGSFHQQIGSYPNMVYVVNQHGFVEFRRFWNQPNELDTHLSGIAMETISDIGCSFPPKASRLGLTLRTLLQAGPRALMEYIKSRRYVWLKRRRLNEFR